MKKFLKNLSAVLIIAGIAWGGWKFYTKNHSAESVPVIAEGEIFDYDVLSDMARKLASQPYVAPGTNLPEEVKELDYDEHRDIRFVRNNGPWFGQRLPFELQFFHLGSLFNVSVPINEVINGRSHPIKYSPQFFDYGRNKLNTAKLENLGYAGFRLHSPLNTARYFDELVSFLGASYFRALGKGNKYGLSARGLAIDTAVQTGEEFPIFKEFWLEKPTRKSQSVIVYALLDSPSVAGAYSFAIAPGKDTVMEVQAKLFPRKEINKLGIAPLTSMFLFGENTKNRFDDHRPEVHDSDGLLVHNHNGEWLWRPLDNSKYLRISAFEDNGPKGFGLMQRDTDPEHYQDFEAMYELRPSAWVEPISDWGKGWVELVEIPSIQEIHDNIVAYWVPKKKAVPGKEYYFQYRLIWGSQIPFEKEKPVAITATRTGIGGVSGMLETEKRKFVVDFAPSSAVTEAFDNNEIRIDASASEGKIVGSHLMMNPLTKGLTAYVDFRPNGKTSELRIVLKKGAEDVSEVWSYQWLP